jgi:hypothetical protein
MKGISVAEYKAMTAKKKKSKYHAKAVVIDGIRFDSTREGERYKELELLRLAGHVKYFFVHPVIRLPGNTKYECDFQIFWSDGRVTYEDVKGVETQVFRLKKRQVEELYPIEIEVIK